MTAWGRPRGGALHHDWSSHRFYCFYDCLYCRRRICRRHHVPASRRHAREVGKANRFEHSIRVGLIGRRDRRSAFPEGETVRASRVSEIGSWLPSEVWSGYPLDECSGFWISGANVGIALTAAGRIGVDIDNDGR